MNDFTPFDHRPDRALGDALREALTAGDDAGFVRRVLVRSRGKLAETESWWDPLGEWARPGLAAAVALLVAVTIWFAREQAVPSGPAQTEDLLVVNAETLNARTLLASRTLPEFDPDVVLTGGPAVR